MLLVFSEGILRQAVELVMPLCSFTMSPPFPAFSRTSQPLPHPAMASLSTDSQPPSLPYFRLLQGQPCNANLISNSSTETPSPASGSVVPSAWSPSCQHTRLVSRELGPRWTTQFPPSWQWLTTFSPFMDSSPSFLSSTYLSLWPPPWTFPTTQHIHSVSHLQRSPFESLPLPAPPQADWPHPTLCLSIDFEHCVWIIVLLLTTHLQRNSIWIAIVIITAQIYGVLSIQGT